MKFPSPKKLSELASMLNAGFSGDADLMISGLNEIHEVETGDLVFVDHPKYYDKALNSKATAVLINNEVEKIPEGKGIIIIGDPFAAFNKLINFFMPYEFPTDQIHPSADIGQGTQIHPSATIAQNVSIGKNCLIYPNVSIGENVSIGDQVIIQSGSVISGNAFYYKKREAGYDRLISCGQVIIEDRVEIGALCSIDKGVTGITRIGKGTKIDNQVHIGHDCHIGENCLFAAQVGIAGCVTVKDGVTLWGQVGISSDLTIGENAVVLGQSGIRKSIEGNKTYFGSPAEEAVKKMRELALIKKIPEIEKEIDKLKNS